MTREDTVPANTESSKPTAETQLQSFVARFAPKDQKLFGALRTAVRKRLPTANELAYDYPDSVVVAYSATEGGIDGIVSIALRPDDLRLYFTNGPKLPDPKKLLKGSAKQVRYIEVTAASQLTDPDVEALFRAAIKAARVPLPTKGKGTLTIRGAAATSKKMKKK